MKKISYWIITVILTIVFPLVGGEIAIRIYHYVKYDFNRNSLKPITLDDKIGWRVTGNYKYRGQKQDASGKKYRVEIQTNKYGFRIFGDPGTKSKKKILFIGDSSTQALDVSNDKTYYGLLKDKIPIEVFAYGGGGYGTLQEYMILDEYIDIIKPDVVVMQVCSNDFINNDYELEVRSSKNNNGMLRPYMTKEGSIIYALPKPIPWLRELINKHSRFLYFVVSRIDRLRAKQSVSVEDIIRKEGRSFPLFMESVEITEQIFQKIKKRIPAETPLYVFSIDDTSPYYNAFKKILNKNKIALIDSVPQAIKRAEQKGIVVRASDKAHWNETGHQIIMDELMLYFETKGL